MKNQTSNHKYDQIFHGLPIDFRQSALELFQYQYRDNLLYREFADCFVKEPASITEMQQIPFMPVSFFKSETIQTGSFHAEIVFESSGTTGVTPARHPVKELNRYRESFVKGFEFFYGSISNYCILGLLPSYLERKGSSLVYMVEELIRMSGHPESNFYLYDFESLHQVLSELEEKKQKTILIGVSFALLDFAEKYPMKLSQTILMETGGMKGRREEIIRAELHEQLTKNLGVEEVHSEYGMTELLSQAYSFGGGIYKPVPWMKMLVRDEDDPLHIRTSGEGLLNIIDLANRDSCAFIATDDVVRLYENGSFEVLGRMDNSDIRGCSLLVT